MHGTPGGQRNLIIVVVSALHTPGRSLALPRGPPPGPGWACYRETRNEWSSAVFASGPRTVARCGVSSKRNSHCPACLALAWLAVRAGGSAASAGPAVARGQPGPTSVIPTRRPRRIRARRSVLPCAAGPAYPSAASNELHLCLIGLGVGGRQRRHQAKRRRHLRFASWPSLGLGFFLEFLGHYSCRQCPVGAVASAALLLASRE